MGTTANGLRYPDPTDAVANGAAAVADLADDVDAAIFPPGWTNVPASWYAPANTGAMGITAGSPTPRYTKLGNGLVIWQGRFNLDPDVEVAADFTVLLNIPADHLDLVPSKVVRIPLATSVGVAEIEWAGRADPIPGRRGFADLMRMPAAARWVDISAVVPTW